MTSACAHCTLPEGDAFHRVACATASALHARTLGAPLNRERLVTYALAALDLLAPSTLLRIALLLDDAVAEHALLRALAAEASAAVHALVLERLHDMGVAMAAPESDDEDASGSTDPGTRRSLASSSRSSPSHSLASSSRSTPRGGAIRRPGSMPAASARARYSPRLEPAPVVLSASLSARESLARARDIAIPALLLGELRGSTSLPTRNGNYSGGSSGSSGSYHRADDRSPTPPPSTPTGVRCERHAAREAGNPLRVLDARSPPSLVTRSMSPQRADASEHTLWRALRECGCATQSASPRLSARTRSARTPSPAAAEARVTIALEAAPSPRAPLRLVELERHVDGEAVVDDEEPLVLSARADVAVDLVAAHRLWFRVRHLVAFHASHARATPHLLTHTLPVCRALRSLTLAYNDLGAHASVFATIAALGGTLEHLCLRGCALSTLPATMLAPLGELVYLDLSHNALTRLPRLALARLRVLLAAHNSLRALPSVRALPALVHLDVAGNRLARVSARQRRALAVLPYCSLLANEPSLAEPLVYCPHQRALATAS